MWYVIKEDELYHHGIKGQKWGVRRFQNPDGTLTAAGRKRIGDRKADDYEAALAWSKKYDAERADNKAAAKARKDAKKQKKSDLKNRSTLSDKELQQKIQRLQMEKQLKELTKNDLHPGRVEAGRILKQIGTRVVATAATGALLYGASHMVEKQGNPDATVDYAKLASAVFKGGAGKKA